MLLKPEKVASCGSELRELYTAACRSGSDISEHLATLNELARQCGQVTEMGTREGNSTVAFLAAQPRQLTCYDIDRKPQVDRLQALRGDTEFRFEQQDVLKVDILPTDLLFIDTFHTYRQCKAELTRHAGKARKWIVLHDTTTFGDRGEDGGLGLWPAVSEFLATSPEWTIKSRVSNNNGLTVLERSQKWAGTIPIYINNFNRLTTTRKLAAWFGDVSGVEVLIVDNASTYPPLLDWYANECPYRIIRLPQNCGHHAPWQQGCVLWGATHRALFGSEFYAVTDSDLDLTGVPKDLIHRLVIGFAVKPDAVKIGVSLEIDDLPECTRERVRNWELQFWRTPLTPDYFEADIDTTLALYRASELHAIAMTTNRGNLRTAKPYTARHMPWYLDPQTLSDEEAYYFQHANGSTNWRPQ